MDQKHAGRRLEPFRQPISDMIYQVPKEGVHFVFSFHFAHQPVDPGLLRIKYDREQVLQYRPHDPDDED